MHQLKICLKVKKIKTNKHNQWLIQLNISKVCIPKNSYHKKMRYLICQIKIMVSFQRCLKTILPIHILLRLCPKEIKLLKRWDAITKIITLPSLTKAHPLKLMHNNQVKMRKVHQRIRYKRWISSSQIKMTWVINQKNIKNVWVCKHSSSNTAEA